MYEGKLVRLTAMKKENLPKAAEYLNDYEVRKNLQPGIPYPYTIEDEHKWYEGISAMKETYTFAIEDLQGRYLGGCGINELDRKNSVAVVGIFIGDKTSWGKGYGSEAMRLLVDFIFSEVNVNKIRLNTYTFNERAIRCYEGCGFKREGVLRQEIYREGHYHDEVIMGLLKNEWESRRSLI